MAAACCQLYVQSTGNVLIGALMGSQVMLMIIDSESTHTFMDKAFAKRAVCTIVHTPSVHVCVANGQMLTLGAQVHGL